MIKDPIVEEIRTNRQHLAEKLNYNIKDIVANAKMRQSTSKFHLVSFAKKTSKP
jgi:hypothetical protein